MPPRPASASIRHPAKMVPGCTSPPMVSDRCASLRWDARRVPPRCDDRRGRRRVRVAAGLRHRGLPRLRARRGDGPRHERQPGRHVRGLRQQPRPDGPALGVRGALPARRLAHLRPAERLVASLARAAGPVHPPALQPGRRRDPHRGPRGRARAGLGAGARPPPRRLGCSGPRARRRTSSSTTRRRATSGARDTWSSPSATARSPSRALDAARRDPWMRDRIVHAYEPKAYRPGGRYLVIGAGIASVNEWANGIDAGAKMIALRRNPAPDEQDLNVPRCLFEAQGIDAYQELSFDERIDFLGRALRGTAPRRRGWLERIERGRREGRFDELVGEIDAVQPGPAGLRLHVSSRHAPDPGWLDVTGVVCGTGFEKNVLALPLMRRLIEHYDLPVVEGRIPLRSNCGVPGLDRPDSRLGAMGLLANNVVPHGDTIAGLKYV